MMVGELRPMGEAWGESYAHTGVSRCPLKIPTVLIG